jgi:hypothetical protein
MSNHEIELRAEAAMTDDDAFYLLEGKAVEEELSNGRTGFSIALRKACSCIRARSENPVMKNLHDGVESPLFP